MSFQTNHAALKEKLIRPCGVTANPSRQGTDPSLLAFVFTLLPNSPGKKDQVSLRVKMTLQSLLIAALKERIED